jgi:hypothetical protein
MDIDPLGVTRLALDERMVTLIVPPQSIRYNRKETNVYPDIPNDSAHEIAIVTDGIESLNLPDPHVLYGA